MILTSRGPLSRAGFLRAVFSLILTALLVSQASASLTVTPITWDVVGLDHNRPLTSGPELFPVGVEVCSDVATTNVEVEMIWEEANSFINTRPGSLEIIEFDELGAGECADAYFEIQLQRSASAFGQSRRYRIEARDASGTFVGPSPREIYIERLVSQNRNSTNLIRYGQQSDGSDWVALSAGTGLALAVGETYFIELTTQTATAYEQLQSFLTLSNTIFQVKAVETTYSTLTAPPSRVPVPNPSLYADGCRWDPDPNSPNYLSCRSTGKAGGTVITVYEIDIISGGGDSVGLLALIYDLSGGSFHYNTDFSRSPGDIAIFDPSASGFSKRFLPATISPGGTSRLQFTITNPNPVALSGYNFVDNLPPGLEVASPADPSSSCGGTWSPLPGDTSLTFAGGTIGANASCTISVNVTAALEGEYDNVSENLFIGDDDTGNNAEATLIVNDGPLPPACVPGTELARWTMDPSQGTTTPPAPFVVHPDVSLATASFVGSALPGVQSINTGAGNPANSWSGTGWGLQTSPTTDGPGPNAASYFQFQLDSSAFASNPAVPIGISIDVNPTPQGNWATENNITANVHASIDGGPFSTIINANGINRAAWTTLTGQIPAGASDVVFRVNVTGRSNGAPNATFLIDNIIFTGCGPGSAGDIPEPPTLAKSFIPATIAAGAVSSLVFELENPNAADALSGVSFDDALPAGMTVASPANAFSNCGGSWAPVSGDDFLQFSGGSIPAASSCTIGVDVTSSTLGTSFNVSDFIFANESGQNAGPDGFASASLTVLAPPQIDKAFDPELLLLGVNEPDVSLLTFTINNPNLFDPISGVAFEDLLPSGLVVAEPASGPEELAVVKSLVGQSASPIVAGTILSYQITASNTDAVLTLNDVVISDSLVAVDLVDDCAWPGPVGVLMAGESVDCTVDYSVTAADLAAGSVTNLVAASSSETGSIEARYRLMTPIVDSGCGMPSWDPQPGDDLLSFANGSIAAGGSCTVSAWVTGPVGVFNNISSPVSHIVSGVVAEGNEASADLVIDQPIPEVIILKQVGLGDDPESAWANYLAVEAGLDVYYRLTVENIGETPLSDINVIDPDVDTSACPWNAPGFELPIADVSDPEAHIAVCIVGPVAAMDGETINIATVSAVGAAQPVEDDDSAIYASTELELLKQADPLTFNAPGELIEYSFTVTNTGAAILEGPVQINDPLISGVSCPPLNTIGNLDNFFDPGETIVCTGSYITTPADVDQGFITNVAFAFTPEAISPVDDVTVIWLGVNPELTVAKALIDSDPDPIELGSVLTYAVTATNTGDTVLSNVVVSDTMLTPASETCELVPVGSSCVLTGTYVVTQADIDNGEIANTGLADSDQSGPDSDTVITPVPQDPAIDLSKVVVAGDPYLNVGDVIHYQITATNSGNVTLTGVVISDPDAVLGACIPAQPTTLLPGESLVCEASYTVSLGDINAGSFTNTATVSSTEPGGDPVTDSDSATADASGLPELSVAKALTDAPSPIVEGSVLTYTVTATNTGNITLNNVVVSDSLISPSSTTCATVLVGESCVLTGTYTVTQGDVDAGQILNTGTAISTETPDPESDTVTTPIDQAPALSVTKALTDAPDPIIEGSVLTYTVTATNTGNVTLNNVVVSDSLISPSSTTCATVLVGESCVLTGTYSVTQGDVDAGQILNTGTAISTETPDPESDTVTTPIDQNPALEVTKALTDAPDPIVEGSVLTYTVTATNTGNVTLTNVIVSDSLITPNSTTCPTVAVGATCVLAGTYTVTQDDVDAGQIQNTGTATSTETPDPEQDTVTTPIIQDPGLSVTKVLTDAPDPIVEGSVLTYTVTATNTGNITLTNVIVSDSLITPDSTTCATVAVGASCVLTGTYTVTQGDVDAGQIQNIGTADSEETGPESDTVTTPIDQDPGLSVTKALTDSPDPIVEGSVLTYTVTATNTGNVTLTNVVVSDNLITPDSITCATVAVGDTCVLTGTYTVTQGDVDAGEIQNVGTADSEETGPESDSVTTPIDQDPGLSVTKTLTDSPDPIVEGSVLTYTVTATNTGNVTLTNVVVSDNLITPDSITCPSVAVGDSCVLTGTYTVTQDDVDAGEIQNTGSADSDETGPEVDTVITPIDQDPALSLTKALTDAPDPIMEGSVLTYTLTATNTGNVTLTNVVVSDDLITPSSETCATLEVGDNCVLVGTYTVTQADVDLGEIENTGSAFSDETPDPIEDTVVTPIAAAPAVELSKVVTAGDPFSAVGDVIEFEITATNIGNVTLFNVSISDPDAELGACVPAQPAELAPGENLVCEASYTITPAEIDAGSFTNTATVTATGPNDEPVEDSDSATALAVERPSVSVTKSSDPTSGEPVLAGDTMTYTIEVLVTNAPLIDTLELTDTLSAGLTLETVNAGDFDCTLGNPLVCSLPSGSDPGSYVLSYTASVDQDANGTLTNAVVVSEPGGDPDPGCESCSTEHPVQSLGLGVITEQCINDVPYVSYQLDLDGFPDPEVTIRWIAIVDGSNSVVEELTLQPDSGQLLWPGAAVDGAGNGIAWPGWDFDPNTGWFQVPTNLRPEMLLEFSVNPTVSVVVEYPPATPQCSANPPLDVEFLPPVPVNSASRTSILLLILLLLAAGATAIRPRMPA